MLSNYSYNRSDTYVSKRANDESEFWKSGKGAYNDDKLKDNILKTTFRNDMQKYLYIIKI